jgi:hypothetical protein
VYFALLTIVRDVYLLKERDTLIISLLSSDQQLSSIVVHEELPRLSYEEYLSCK